MKVGFSKNKKGHPKEDIRRNQDKDPKELLTGLAVTTALLGGLAAASLKAAEIFGNGKDKK